MLALLLLAAGLAAPDAARQSNERTFERLKPSLFTIEVHSGNQDAKSSLGSAYVVADGVLATNYHVVASYIADPQRYSLRAKGAGGEWPARVLRFDLVNDLALLKAEGLAGPALRLAERPTDPGTAVVAFGNPGGLGLSLVAGVCNGLASKGLVDRLLLSMPLNSGMSGGPILNAAGEVIGTNVSVMWLSNSLSFGVPVAKLRALLQAPAVESSEAALLAETHRQFEQFESQTAANLKAGFERAHELPEVVIGGARSQALPAQFECWDGSKRQKDQRVSWSWYGCNLQFTPSVEPIGPVASMELFVQHTAAAANSFGTFGLLQTQAAGHNQVGAAEPNNGVRSSPHCTAERVLVGGATWKLSTCLQALVKHPGLYEFELSGTSLGARLEGTYLWVRMKGFTLESFQSLSHSVLAGMRPEVGQP